MHTHLRLIFTVVILLIFSSKAFADYKTYVAKDGDTLSEIAQEHYGSYTWYTDIQKASYIHDADWIFVGQVIILPDPDEVQLKSVSIPLSLTEVVSLNEHNPWIPRVLENPTLINHLTRLTTHKTLIEREILEESELRLNDLIIADVSLNLLSLPLPGRTYSPDTPVNQKTEGSKRFIRKTNVAVMAIF